MSLSAGSLVPSLVSNCVRHRCAGFMTSRDAESPEYVQSCQFLFQKCGQEAVISCFDAVLALIQSGPPAAVCDILVALRPCCSALAPTILATHERILTSSCQGER
jgi:hypothetical protein